jgi:hypothetical protein
MPGEDFHLSDYARFQAHTSCSFGAKAGAKAASINVDTIESVLLKISEPVTSLNNCNA